MRTKFSRSPWFTILIVCLSFAGAVPAQTIYPFKLNGTLPTDGDVLGDFQISADGSRAVYRADEDTNNVVELYSVLTGGGTPVKLNGTLVAGGGVEEFQISPDGSRVVYRAVQDSEANIDLYSVPIGGGVAVKLNGALVDGGIVSGFKISADSGRVVYVADQDAGGVLELYSVPIAGGTVVKLNGVLVADGDVLEFQVSAESSRVVYLADQDVDSVNEIYSVPIAGGRAEQLNGTLVTGGDVLEFEISQDNSQVVYLADEDTDERDELYSVVLSGAPVKLSAVSFDEDAKAFRISPDSSRVVYLADQEFDGTDELYSVPIGGGTQVRLNGILFPFVGDVVDFDASPDGSRVVYRAQQDSVANELYSVPIDGGIAVRLNGPLVVDGEVLEFQIDADGNRVVYRGDQDADTVNELYSVPITGGGVVKLNAPLVAGGGVAQFRVSPDSSVVAFRADQEIDEKFELYSIPTGGGSPVKLNGGLVVGGDVGTGFQISGDGSRVVYSADQEADEVFELFVGRAQAIWESSGGSWFVSANWRDGVRPNQTVEAVIAVPAVVQISSSATAVVTESLVLGGGGGRSVVELLNGTALSLERGAQILADGVVRGDGVLSVGSLPLALPAGAELRAAGGERLVLQSGLVTNGGVMEASGSGAQQAELEYLGAVENVAGTGAITGDWSVLRFAQGLQNSGSLSFAGGFNEVRGDVGNQSSGGITVSGGAEAVFFEDVINEGAINVSASGQLESTAVFFGALSGNGVSGGGHVFIEGDARPGFSAGIMAFGGDLSYGPRAEFEVELGGPDPGKDSDQVTVAGHLELAGRLTVRLLGDFVPSAGMVFDVWEAASVSGTFSSVSLPALPQGLFWQTRDLHATGELRVGLAPESFAEFAAHYGLVNGVEGDEEGDGVLNLFEYLSGGNPLAMDGAGPMPEVVPAGAADEVSFLFATPGGHDVAVEVETSTTLREGGSGGWEVIASRIGDSPWTGSAPVALTPAGDGRERVTISSASTGDPVRFYRVRASLIP